MPKEESTSKDRLKEAYLELLVDSLSSVTRSTRNKVILFSTLGLIVAFTGLTPVDPKFSGFQFPGLTQNFVIASITIAILYSTVSFIAYSSVDRSRYLHHLDTFQKAKAIDLFNNYDHQKDDYEHIQESEFKDITGYDFSKFPKQSSQNVSFRSLLDFHLPWFYGSTSLFILICHQM